MNSHLLLLLVFVTCVSAVMAVIQKDDHQEQVRLALYMIGGFTGAAILLGWLMYPLPW
jgi:uncharacterized membrane protein